MPVGKRQQSNTMLYTVIIFVGLFLVTTVLAVVFYLQAEKHRTKAVALQNQMDDLTSGSELQRIGAIVGARQPQKSRLGTMVDYLDKTVSLIVGGLPEDTSAELKVDTTDRKVKDTLELLAQPYSAIETVAPEAPDNKFVELLANQNFTAVTADFNETLKNELPVEKLEETWKSAIEQMGPFKKQLGFRTEKSDPNTLLVTCQFEKGSLDVKIVYNDKKQVTGLSLLPTPEDIAESYQKPPQLTISQKPYIEIDDPNTVGLISVIEKLKTKLDDTTKIEIVLHEQLDRLKNRFDDAMAAGFEKEQTLLAEKEKYQQQINEIKQDYNDLKVMLQQTSEQQVQTLMAQVEEERDNRKKLNQQLLKTEAELVLAQERIKRSQGKLDTLVPPPDSEIAAYKPDGKIVLIDESVNIVYINIGSDNHAYRGLTFSVYEKNMPIPRDGKGKAEIEVFNVGKNISAARITNSDAKKPIILDDIVANLIWDSDKRNVFVVAGEFDIDDDGNVDYEAADKIKALIKSWGGKVADDISIDTDFIVLGTMPSILRKPSFEQMEVDPMAMEKYEASLDNLESYQNVQMRAETLSIPVFNLERFLYFIGYKTQSVRPGAF
ncbi:MAG: DUF3887 domain-containing protein [Phycisphaerae bacterium]|nr:DUF3887 domain-containing protein [Phycisphaerae bacterium]